MTFYEEHNIKAGKYTYGYPNCKGNGNEVTIGSFTSIGSNVVLDRGFNHSTSNISTFPFHNLVPTLPSNIVIKGPIEIGSDVWLGDDCVIMSNVKIGHGAVVGMRCIVSKDVQPYEIVVGAPQKVLRKRFYEYDIIRLLELKWWDFEDEEIIKIAPLLASNKLEELFKLYNL